MLTYLNELKYEELSNCFQIISCIFEKHLFKLF